MLFNSIEFILFFPVVTLLYYLTPHKFRWIQLLIASCVFYAAFIPSYIFILFFLILIDYVAGIKIEKTRHKKRWLLISIIANIGLLAFFKYFNFFIENANSLTGSHLILLHIALPIGLSFHTFQSISYTIEVYRGNQKAIKHLGYYSLYVMFYPQLVAGPIERPYHLFPQLFATHKFSSQNLYEGLRLMAWGFFKKTVIADRLSGYVDTVFNSHQDYTAANIWIAVFFFSIQIYADFSGYSDIATGAARCMGFDLMINFNRPYESKNIREFWRKWHISLSTWFRDYVYIPLGGNRHGVFKKRISLLLTFILSGLWHGAGWTFVAWGFLHGLFLIIYDLFSTQFQTTKIARPLSLLITFFCTGFAWIFFRAASIDTALSMIAHAANPATITLSGITALKSSEFRYGNFSFLIIFLSIIYMLVLERFTNPLLTNLNNKKIADVVFFAATVIGIIFLGIFHKTSFIYFQF